jgi:hypothetical protein
VPPPQAPPPHHCWQQPPPPQQQRRPHRQPGVAPRGPAGYCCHILSVDPALKHHKGVCDSSKGRPGGSWASGVVRCNAVRCGRQAGAAGRCGWPQARVLLPHTGAGTAKQALSLTEEDVAALAVLAINVSQACKGTRTEMPCVFGFLLRACYTAAPLRAAPAATCACAACCCLLQAALQGCHTHSWAPLAWFCCCPGRAG